MFEIRDFTHEQFVAASFLETDHFVADVISRIAYFTFLRVYRCFHNSVHNQNITSEKRVGYFEEIFTIYVMHFKKAVHCFGFAGDYFCVRLQSIFLTLGNGVSLGFIHRFRLALLFLLFLEDVRRLCSGQWNDHCQNHQN